VVDFETMDSGFLAKVFVEAGTTVDCGTPIGILVEDASDLGAFENLSASDFGDAAKQTSSSNEEEASSLDTIPAKASSSSSSTSFPEHEVLGLPALSPTMETGIVSKWLKKQGEEIIAGDIICEVETDKATVDFEATDDGFLAKVLCEEGVTMDVGHPIAVIVEDGDDIAAFESFVPGDSSEVASEVAVEEKQQSETVVVSTTTTTTPTSIPPSPTPKTTTTTTTIPADGDMSHMWRREVTQRSPLSYSMSAAQLRYIEEFGETGMEPLSRPE